MIYMRLENFEEYCGSSPNYTEIYELIHIFVKNNPGANLSSTDSVGHYNPDLKHMEIKESTKLHNI
ncbi:MAG: hypothetical protein QXO15_07795 [Nitrososphaerota archaeon]